MVLLGHYIFFVWNNKKHEFIYQHNLSHQSKALSYPPLHHCYAHVLEESAPSLGKYLALCWIDLWYCTERTCKHLPVITGIAWCIVLDLTNNASPISTHRPFISSTGLYGGSYHGQMITKVLGSTGQLYQQ